MARNLCGCKYYRQCDEVRQSMQLKYQLEFYPYYVCPFKESMEMIEAEGEAVKIFTYGTLKSGFHNNTFLQNSTYISDAKLKGFEMHDLTYGYPGIVEGDGEVYGEVYEVSPVDLVIVDQLEGFYGESCKDSNLYNREKVKVKLDNGEEVEVYTYVFARELPKGSELIKDGNWNRRYTPKRFTETISSRDEEYYYDVFDDYSWEDEKYDF